MVKRVVWLEIVFYKVQAGFPFFSQEQRVQRQNLASLDVATSQYMWRSFEYLNKTLLYPAGSDWNWSEILHLSDCQIVCYYFIFCQIQFQASNLRLVWTRFFLGLLSASLRAYPHLSSSAHVRGKIIHVSPLLFYSWFRTQTLSIHVPIRSAWSSDQFTVPTRMENHPDAVHQLLA